MKRCIRKIVSVVLAATLCLAMGSVAFAASPVTGTEEKPAKAYLTKEFQMPEGTTTPTAKFTFNITPVSVDGKDYDATAHNMPTDTIEMNYTSSSTGATTAEGVKTYVNSAELFEDQTWPHAGVYKYTITEADGGLTEDTDDSTKETLTNSDAEYTMTVYVKNGANGTYVSAISVVQTKDDNGDEVGEEGAGTKVDPSQPGTDQEGKPTGGELRFTNTYTKKINVTPVDPENPDPDNPGDTDANDKGLSVKKIVTGDLGDTTKDFKFTVKVTKPSLASETVYTAKIMTPGSSTGEEVSFTSGEEKEITLKHGQELVFTDLYVGTDFVIQETDSDVSTSNEDVNKYVATTYSKLNNGELVTASGAASITGKVSEGNDLVSVVNDRNAETPTGILVNNLPFIMMIAVAACGFAAYITIRRRRAML